MKDVALLNGAAIFVIGADDIGVDATSGRAARVRGASVLIVAGIGSEVGVHTADLGIAGVDRAGVAIVAINRRPGALLVLALVNGAEIVIEAELQLGGNALSTIAIDGVGASSGSAGAAASLMVALPVEAGGARGARDVGHDALLSLDVARSVRALVGGLADSGGLLAAHARDLVFVARLVLVAGIRGNALTTASAETAAVTAGSLLDLASKADDIEETIGERVEVVVAKDALGDVASEHEKLSLGEGVVWANTNGEGGDRGDLLVGIVDSELQIVNATVATAAAREVGAVVVVETVSEDDEDLLDTRTASHELVGTLDRARADRGTAAAASVLRGIEVVTTGDTGAGEGRGERIVHVGLVGALDERQGGPGLLHEVDEGKVGLERAIAERASEANGEVLLTKELGVANGARAIEDNGNVDGLTALATLGGGEGRCRDGGVGVQVGELVVAATLEDDTADGVAIEVDLGDISTDTSLGLVLEARLAVDHLGSASGLVVAVGGVTEQLGHGDGDGGRLAVAAIRVAVEPLAQETDGEGLGEVTATLVVELVDLSELGGSVVEAEAACGPVILDLTIDNATTHARLAELEVSGELLLGKSHNSERQ